MSNTSDYKKLLEPGRIGKLQLRNRSVMMPMATDMADKDGIVTPRQIRYYQERAKGGIGMIINEYTGVDDIDSIPSIHNLRIARDYHISAMEELTDAVHMYGALICAQIHHGGATSNPNFTGRQNLAPSAVPIADGRPVPKEMTIEDIKRVEQKFIDAAVRCKKAGYDAVELHGAHGYLMAQFWSKYYNRRTDEYGGSVENRCRFIAEIIAGIREKLGDFPIIVRMCGDEMTPVEGFLTLEDGLEIAKYLESLGIDAINISNGSARNGDANCEPFSYQPGWKKHVAKAYKEALSIPVIATNTIKNPEFAEQMLEEEVCDFVGLGRSQLADPYFMQKTADGCAELVTPCIGCLYCRERVLRDGLPIRCAVNPRTAREIDFDYITEDGYGGSVVVIGTGPAGMEAAKILAMRGFEVTIIDRNERPGGTLNIADKPPFKDKITAYVDSMERQLLDLGVSFMMGVEVSEASGLDLIKSLDPEAIFYAAGAAPVVPGFCQGKDNVYIAEDVITSAIDPEGKVAIIGSGLTGLETAEVLIENGHKIAMVDMLPEIGPGIFPAIRNDELSRVLPADPELFPGHGLVSIDEGSITIKEVATGEIKTVEADSVVLALGVRPRTAAIDYIRSIVDDEVPIITIGDANKSGRIATATRDGFEAAWIY